MWCSHLPMMRSLRARKPEKLSRLPNACCQAKGLLRRSSLCLPSPSKATASTRPTAAKLPATVQGEQRAMMLGLREAQAQGLIQQQAAKPGQTAIQAALLLTAKVAAKNLSARADPTPRRRRLRSSELCMRDGWVFRRLGPAICCMLASLAGKSLGMCWWLRGIWGVAKL